MDEGWIKFFDRLYEQGDAPERMDASSAHEFRQRFILRALRG